MEPINAKSVKRCCDCKYSHFDVEDQKHFCTQPDVVNYLNQDDPQYLAGDSNQMMAAVLCVVERCTESSPCGSEGLLWESREEDYEENPNAFFDDTAENSGPWSGPEEVPNE